MKRHALLLSLVGVMLLTLSVPAVAKKPSGPPGPPSDLSVTMSVGNYATANSEDDVIDFTITVTNNSGGQLTDINVAVGSEGTSEYSTTIAELAADATWIDDIDGIDYKYTVTSADLLLDEITKTVVVNATQTATASTEVYYVAPCETDFSNFETSGDVCSWEPTKLGTWTITVTPGDTITRPTRVGAALRDGVPGNWCGGGSAWWKPGGPPVEVTFYLPANGTCLEGGNGGITMPTRNSNLFYLNASKGSSVTATWVSAP